MFESTERHFKKLAETKARASKLLTSLELDPDKFIPIWSEISDDEEKSHIIFTFYWLVAGSTLLTMNKDTVATVFFLNLSVTLLLNWATMHLTEINQIDHIERNLKTIKRLAKIDPTLPKYFYEHYGIRVFCRYPITYYVNRVRLDQSHVDDNANERSSRKTILIIKALNDPNLALIETDDVPFFNGSLTSKMLKFWKHGFDYYIIEAGSVEEIIEIIRTIEPHVLQSIEHIHINAHGSIGELSLSNNDVGTTDIEVNDEVTADLLANAFAQLPAAAEVTIGACHASGTDEWQPTSLTQWLADAIGRKVTGSNTESASNIDLHRGKIVLVCSRGGHTACLPSKSQVGK